MVQSCDKVAYQVGLEVSEGRFRGVVRQVQVFIK